MYEPWDAWQAPRFTGPRTYARLPWVKDQTGVEAAGLGLPWDGARRFAPAPASAPRRSGPSAVDRRKRRDRADSDDVTQGKLAPPGHPVPCYLPPRSGEGPHPCPRPVA